MTEKNLKSLKQYYPELRYLFFHVKKKDRQNYIMHSDSKFVNMMVQICLNLVYCEKNSLKLTAAQNASFLPTACRLIFRIGYEIVFALSDVLLRRGQHIHRCSSTGTAEFHDLAHPPLEQRYYGL